jgi:hypothetical protein
LKICSNNSYYKNISDENKQEEEEDGDNYDNNDDNNDHDDVNINRDENYNNKTIVLLRLRSCF